MFQLNIIIPFNFIRVMSNRLVGGECYANYSVNMYFKSICYEWMVIDGYYQLEQVNWAFWITCDKSCIMITIFNQQQFPFLFHSLFRSRPGFDVIAIIIQKMLKS